MTTQTSFHRRSHPKGLMHAPEVVPHVEQRNHVHVVLNLLGERIGQTSESAHLHPHCEVLALDEAGRDMAGIGIADDFYALGAQTLRRAVALLSFGIVAIDFDQLSVVYIAAKRIRDGVQVHLMSVRSELNAIRQALGNILKELRRMPGFPPTNKPTDNQLRVRVNRGERPNVTADALLRHFERDVLLLGVAERPNFIDLNALRFDVPQGGILIVRARLADAFQQTDDSALRYASQSNRGADRASLDKRGDHRYFLRVADYVRHKTTIRERFRISKRKVEKNRFLGFIFGFCPASLRGFFGASAPLLVRHGLHAALAADLASLASHVSHDLLNQGKGNGFSGFYGLKNYAACILDGIKFCIGACPLWHMPQACHETGGTSTSANFK